jgi:hypothetical protein
MCLAACSDDASSPPLPDAGAPFDAALDAARDSSVDPDADAPRDASFDAGRDSAVGADAGDAAIAPDAGPAPDCAEELVEIFDAPGDDVINNYTMHDYGDHWLGFHRITDAAGDFDFVVTSIDRDGRILGRATLPRSPALGTSMQFWPLSVGGSADEFVAMSSSHAIRYRYDAGTVTAVGDGVPVTSYQVWTDRAAGQLNVLHEVRRDEFALVRIRRDDAVPEGLSSTLAGLGLVGADRFASLTPGPDRMLVVRRDGDDKIFSNVLVAPDGTVTRTPPFVWSEPDNTYPIVRDPSAPRWLFALISRTETRVDLYAFDDADPPTAPVLLAPIVTAADGFARPRFTFATDSHGSHLFAVGDADAPLTIFRTSTGEVAREASGPVYGVIPPIDPTDFRFAALVALDPDSSRFPRRVGLRCIDVPPAP